MVSGMEQCNSVVVVSGTVVSSRVVSMRVPGRVVLTRDLRPTCGCVDE